MIFIISLFLIISIAINGVFIWYTRKLVQNLYYGVNNVDELQKLLNEYVSLLEPIATMENYYGEPAITSAVANTKMVIEACKAYKNSIIESQDEENQEFQETEEESESSKDKNEKAFEAKASISSVQT